MSLEKSQALVLRVILFGDTSKVVTVYTQDHGLVALLAKGVRGPKPRFGAALEIFAVIDLVYYQRDARELQLLSQAMLMDAHLGLSAHPRRFLLGSAVLEFLLRILSGQEPPGRLYALSCRTLEVLESSPDPALLGVFHAFQIKAAAFLGHRPELYICVECGRDVTEERDPAFSAHRGGTICRACDGGDSASPSGGAVPALRALLTATLADLAASPLPPTTLVAAARALDAFLGMHVAGYQPLRALRMAGGFEERSA